MRDKRLATGLTMAVALGLVWSPRGLSAQNSDGQWRLPAQSGQSGGSQRGVERQPAPTQVVNAPTSQATVFRRPVAFTFVPAILMSDGTVFANFGAGFEPVLRSCAATLVVGQPTVVASNGVVLSQPQQQPTYTQPVPNQQTPSQVMVTTGQRAPSVIAQRSCFQRDAAGRVFVLRP